jgi:hypothetical protein
VQAEINAGITPTNTEYPPGNVLRYGTNTTPGTTDMSAALQAAVTVALAGIGAGKSGIPVYLPYGAYSIVTPPTFGAATTQILPIDIGGDGWGTQIINNAAASHPTFDMSGKNGWRIHDLLLCGNSSHLNDGIHVNHSSGPQTVGWRIENVLAMMAGSGIVLADTNTGVIRNFHSWPDNAAGLLQVAQSVTPSDIRHHIYLTGGFVHNVSLYDCWVTPSVGYAIGARGIKCDAAASLGLNIIGGLGQGESGSNTEIALDLANCTSFLVQGFYHENAQIRLTNSSNGTLMALDNGGSGGGLIFQSNSDNNTLIGLFQATATLSFDSGSIANTVMGCYFSVVNDSGTPPNQFVNTVNPNRGANLGQESRTVLLQASTLVPDRKVAETFVVRMLSSSPMTINPPLHMVDGSRLYFTIRNETGGPLGAIAFSGYGSPPFTPPNAGYNRTICFMYDAFFGQIRMLWASGSDVPN